MSAAAETKRVSSPEGDIDLFVAKPSGNGPHPGLIVIQEAFGVNDHIKDVTRRFADQGYHAVAPDLFHRFEQRLVDYSDIKTALGTIAKLDDDKVMNDLNAAFTYLRSQPDVRRDRIATIGYCFGGRSSYLAATRNHDLAAAVVYYGGGTADPSNPNAPVTRTADITCPMVAFFGGQDQMIPQEQVKRIEEELAKHGKEHSVKVYPQAGHGFFCDARPAAYNAEAAKDAWNITLDFLGKKLKA